jgi:phosphoglycolate phosphatase
VGDAVVVGDLPRLIVFDLDGTLIDSRRDLTESANELIAELGGTPLSEDAVGGMVGEGAALLVRRALEAARLTVPEGALSRFLDIYDQRLLNHTRLYPGIAAALLRAQVHARLAVLTNKGLAPSDRILRALGVRDRFDLVVGGDGPHPRKPDPTGLRAIMASTGSTAGRTLLVGDSAIDAETARRAGVACVLVSYGFSYWTILEAGLDASARTARNAAELTALIARFVASP